MAPAILLEKLDFLKGKKMTVFKSKNTWSVEQIKQNAVYIDEPVVIDGNIITCRNEEDAKLLGDKLIEIINKDISI